MDGRSILSPILAIHIQTAGLGGSVWLELLFFVQTTVSHCRPMGSMAVLEAAA